jgi:hypothetical protein
MNNKTSQQPAVTPSDFLYYDPYYLLLKERSKSYPKVVEKYYHTRLATDKGLPSAPSVTNDDSVDTYARNDINEIMSSLSQVFDGNNLLGDNKKSFDFLSASGLIQSLLSTSITEATAFDPLLGSRIRKIGDYVTRQETLIRDLISRTLDLDTEKKQMGMEAEESAVRLQSNTRAMNALYSDVDSYKLKLESVEKRGKVNNPVVQQELDDLRARYFVAMKIIDKMNWPSPDDDSGTFEIE